MNKKWIYLICSAAFLVIVANLLFHWRVSEGYKSGVIVNVHRDGMFLPTYQGELIKGGFEDMSGAMGRTFYFNLGFTKNANYKKAMQALSTNRPVLIKYHCNAYVPPWEGSANCFLDDITSCEHENK